MKPTFLLLHGTGGDESSLLFLGKRIDPEVSLLSVRGNVLEEGMPRFFKRVAEGVFDEVDLIFRTKELYEFIGWAAKEYGFNRSRVMAVGYSNGANIAAILLFHYQDALIGAILHHPMVPIRGIKLPDLSGKPVFIGAGTNDPLCSPDETKELQFLLAGARAETKVHWEQGGHQLTESEIEAAARWYQKWYREIEKLA